MQCPPLDDCSGTLRDAYGFQVPALYSEIHRSFAPLWLTEEGERGERWSQWLQSFRNLNLKNSTEEGDAQLMEQALFRYTAGGNADGNTEGTTSGSTNTANDNNSQISLEEAELLQNLRALVQMGIPINRRAQFWSVFLNIKSKKQPPEYYSSLVQASLDRETEFKKAESLASYQITRVADNGVEELGKTTTLVTDNEFEDCFCVTPLTASSDSDDGSSSSAINSSPVCTPNALFKQVSTIQHQYEDWLPQIDKDLHRTFPDHPMMDTSGRAALRRILGAYSIRNPYVGYCQGLNFLAATFMLLFNEEDAFWCLVVVVEDLLPGYFDLKMIAPQVDGQVLAHLLRGAAPRVAQHLDTLQVDIPSATSAWFLVAFLNSLPLETCLRVWDVFFFEKSSVVLFRAALALIDTYSQALLETDDSSEAYLLLQALGPMSFDSSRLIDSACIGFAHVNDAALRVLRDKYRPQVLETMESMFSCNEELQTYFESAMNEAATANSLSRSQSFSETLAAAASRSAALASTGGSDASSISVSRGNSISPSSTPSSPLSRYNSSKSTLERAAPKMKQKQPASPTALAYKQPSLSLSPLGSQMKEKHIQQLRSPSPLLVLRRSCSAATLGRGALCRSDSSLHHYVRQHIDLHSLAAFVPDITNPKIAALYQIAAKPSSRKIVATTSNSNSGSGSCTISSIDTTKSELNASINEKRKDLNVQWESALSQLPTEFQAALSTSHHNHRGDGSLFDNGATIDIGGLAGLIKALKYGQNTNQQNTSQETGGGEKESIDEKIIKKKVLRRATDGGALLGKKEIGLFFTRNFEIPLKHFPPDNNDNVLPSPGSNTEKLEQLYRLRDELATEVAAAGRRQTAAMEASIEAVDTAEALHRQLAKIQAEIDVKMGSLLALYNRISSVDFATTAEEDEEKAELAALEASTALLEELKKAKMVSSAVVAAFMAAVDGNSKQNPKTLLQRYL